MPKIIQPRRHSKSISVEDFWSLREQQKERTEQKQSEPIYKEEEVENRHRYLRPSEQAKRFNPLAYTFRRETSVVSCQA